MTSRWFKKALVRGGIWAAFSLPLALSCSHGTGLSFWLAWPLVAAVLAAATLFTCVALLAVLSLLDWADN